MSGTSGAYKTVQSPEQIFSLLYTTGYRLTGNHQLTAELIEVSINTLSQEAPKGRNKLLNGVSLMLKGGNNIGFSAILKTLCSAFIKKSKFVSGRVHSAPLSSFELTHGRTQVQEALLYLPPMERLLVVLRDMLGLSYVEIADLAGLQKTDVASLLSAGRWTLRELLAVSKSPGNLPKRTRVAK